MEKLQDIWVFLTTPGTQMPMNITVGALIAFVIIAILLPQFVQWRAYRKEKGVKGYNPDVWKKDDKAVSGKTPKNLYPNTAARKKKKKR